MKQILISIASFTAIITSLVVIFIMVYPFDVLKTWTLSTDTSKVYREGDTIWVTSKSVKVIDAPSQIQQFIECQDGKNVTESYPISTRPSAKKPGTLENKFPMTIPLYVINGLPTKCRVSIDTVYSIYGIREVVEHANTDWFTVNPVSRDAIKQ